jgi:anti-sigma regulatory factor (Ser/Thr protein kinase)
VTSPATAGLHRDYDGDAVTLRAARRDVVEWLSGCGADGATKERAALIVSELASNALQASPGSVYRVRLVRVDHDHAAISVSNQSAGAGPPDREHWHPADAMSLSGRGLSIVDSLSMETTVEQRGAAVVVTAVVHLDFG